MGRTINNIGILSTNYDTKCAFCEQWYDSWKYMYCPCGVKERIKKRGEELDAEELRLKAQSDRINEWIQKIAQENRKK